MTNTYGDFSPSTDPEDEAFHCTPDHIPILPVRFSLLPYDLGSVTKPTGIGNPGSYIVRTVRRGFIYIYIEAPEDSEDASSRDGIWYVFRRQTDPRDINADVAPENTEITERGASGFIKYEWTDNYGEGDWTFGGLASRTCWVPRWASKVWIAYSEYRWPPVFFRRGHDAGFRAQLMTPVNLRAKNDWAAYIGEAMDIVEEFKPDDTRQPWINARLALSQTGFEYMERTSWSPMVTDENDECVAVVGVMDPMGDIAEMQYRLEQLDDHQKSFHAAHIYPLTIGRFCKQLKNSIRERDSWYHGTWFANGPALQPSWEVQYDGLHGIALQLRRSMNEIIAGVTAQMLDQSKWMLGKHLDLAGAEAANGDIDAAEYFSVLFGRAVAAISFVPAGSATIRKSLGADVDAPGASIDKWLARFRSIWGGLRNVAYGELRKRQYSFRIGFEAVAVELATEIAEGRVPIGSWQDALDAGFRQGPNARLQFSTTTLPLDDAINFVSNGQNASVRAGYTATELATTIDDALGRATSGQITVAGATADIPTIRTATTVELVGGFDTAGRIATAELTYAGAGLFLSTWALVATAKGQAQADGLFARGGFTGTVQSQPFQIGAAAVNVAEALRTTHAAYRTTQHTTARISAEALETLYNGAARRTTATLVTTRSATAGAVGRSLGYLGPRIVVGLGAVVATAGIVRGVERDDRSEISGNVVMLIGGLMFFPGLNIGFAIAGGIILAVGFLITLTSYGPVEDVVRTSFWGTSDEYLDLDPRPSATEMIDRTRNLPTPYDNHYAEEVAVFGELDWKPEIVDPVPGDNSVVVRSGALSGGSTSTVNVSAKYRTQTARGMRDRPVSVSKTIIPGQPAMRVTLGNAYGNPVTITASTTGPRTAITHETSTTFSSP